MAASSEIRVVDRAAGAGAIVHRAIWAKYRAGGILLACANWIQYASEWQEIDARAVATCLWCAARGSRWPG